MPKHRHDSEEMMGFEQGQVNEGEEREKQPRGTSIKALATDTLILTERC